jgi:AbrB family transcriptional regulator, transcriptional pleiotropic regulator of transition state genes
VQRFEGTVDDVTIAQRTGVARKIDQLGRVVLPAEVRREFGIEPGDLVEIGVDGASIVLRKVEDRCVFCGAESELAEFSGKLVCDRCASALSASRA